MYKMTIVISMRRSFAHNIVKIAVVSMQHRHYFEIDYLKSIESAQNINFLNRDGSNTRGFFHSSTEKMEVCERPAGVKTKPKTMKKPLKRVDTN